MKKKTSQSLLPWEEVKKLNLSLFHTLRGPIMGYVSFSGNNRSVRVWAPAVVVFAPPSNVLFQPVAFVDYYIDLHWSTMFGTSLVSDLLAKGYLGYFEQFIKGNYMMKPHIQSMEPPKAEAPEVNLNETRLETCPACKQGVSNWQSHFPVLLEDGADAGWHCEIDVPDIRERYQGYNPPRPQDA